ncbi:hypothetical protein I316_06786 [Kwoniella heveanensis BCC8398]|uniref:Uncharacterized protein n=1 Tax=Kwoniella heveanensis BCC8398 TaxID=1296120 RepID=A0A1B9GKR7_9TREE|nr:hypothetical protein I316_06786 [Kwoniella heveanensis BCC8398]
MPPSSHNRRRSGTTEALLESMATPDAASSSTDTVPSPSNPVDHVNVNATSVLDRLSSTTTAASSSSSNVRTSSYPPSSTWTFGRKRRIYCQVLALVLLGVWIHFEWPRSEHVPSSSSMGIHEKTSYLLGRSVCPSPARPHFPVDQPIGGYAQKCSKAPTVNPDFEVEICPVKTTCNSFSVRIRRTKSAECERLEGLDVPVDDEDLGKFLKEHRGPDSFFLRTSGAQRWVSELSDYEGDCSYRFDVTLSNGGPVWLELYWFYTEYAYFNEQSKAWPENHFESLFSAPMRLETCPERCPMYYAPRLRDDETFWPTGLTLSPADHTSRLPDCSLEERSSGLWLQRHPMDVIDPPVPVIAPITGFKPLMGVYEYFKPQCKWAHRGSQFEFDHQKCTKKKKKVLLSGDSHGRYVLNHLKHRLDNQTTYFSTMSTEHGPFHYEYDQLTVDFWWSAREEYLGFDTKELGTYDSILFSYGAWELMVGSTVDVFRRKLEGYFKMVDEAQRANDPTSSRHREKVFLVGPPIPPRVTGMAREKADQRTNHRFAVWRDIALDLCAQYGWRVVDQFQIATPVTLEILAVDGGHLSPGSAHPPIIDEVIAKLGMCQ